MSVVEKDVRIEDATGEISDAVGAAYRTKYARYADSYLPPMVRPPARETTLRLSPT